MLILIDKTALRMVAAAGSRKWINLVSYVDFPNVESIIVDSLEGKTWSVLDADQMGTLYTNMSGQPAPAYGDCITQLSAYAETWPAYPKSEAALEVEAEAIFQAEETAKTPEDRADDAKQSAAIQRAAHQETIALVEAANTALSPEQKAQADASSPAPAEKAPRAASEPPARPQQGATKKIWDIADELLMVTGSVGNIKMFRTEVISRAKAQGLNEGTAATQFGKWKASKGL